MTFNFSKLWSFVFIYYLSIIAFFSVLSLMPLLVFCCFCLIFMNVHFKTPCWNGTVSFFDKPEKRIPLGVDLLCMMCPCIWTAPKGLSLFQVDSLPGAVAQSSGEGRGHKCCLKKRNTGRRTACLTVGRLHAQPSFSFEFACFSALWILNI